jgi:plastocyanin
VFVKNRRGFAILVGLVLLAVLPVTTYLVGKEKEKGGAGKYLCTEPSPQGLCNPATTCGSPSTPCAVDIKRTSSSASITPDIAGAKANAPFCVAAGTTITWKSMQKNTGFVIDFGSSSPLDSGGTVIGGSDREASTVAKKPGCYRFSVGACISGSIYGMCGEGATEIIVTGAGG